MAHETSLAERALEIARLHGIARAQDFRAAGIPPAYLTRLAKQGRLTRLGRGLYQLADLSGSDASHDLAEAARLIPHGVISLLSALRLHGLTTQLPGSVWMTLAHKARAPKSTPFKLEVIRASGRVFSEGRAAVKIEGVSVPVYNVAKTIADCFKHRRRVGLDVAVEALRDALKQRKATRADLWRYAKLCRVENIMRPYLEALA
ncbi:MAG: type IV toxin-antitoxin system AbiEi family antitoxin domain-containing protein [Alphaproteobacteria bacterium]